MLLLVSSNTGVYLTTPLWYTELQYASVSITSCTIHTDATYSSYQGVDELQGTAIARSSSSCNGAENVSDEVVCNVELVVFHSYLLH